MRHLQVDHGASPSQRHRHIQPVDRVAYAALAHFDGCKRPHNGAAVDRTLRSLAWQFDRMKPVAPVARARFERLFPVSISFGADLEHERRRASSSRTVAKKVACVRCFLLPPAAVTSHDPPAALAASRSRNSACGEQVLVGAILRHQDNDIATMISSRLADITRRRLTGEDADQFAVPRSAAAAAAQTEAPPHRPAKHELRSARSAQDIFPGHGVRSCKYNGLLAIRALAGA